MAVVYAATHRNGHRVAIKFLLDHLLDASDAHRLFSREAYVANEVGHPGAVPVLDDDVDEEGCPFLIMPLLEGETIRARWEREDKHLPALDVTVLAADVLDVLAAAHAKGIVHRDIKPDNLFLTNEGSVRVLDFGIARRWDRDGSTTLTGQMFGTPAFMPPEQALGDRDAVGPHSDCWAVGATIFTLLSGELVHPADNPGAQLVAAGTRHARSLADVALGLPPPLVEWVSKALAFAPSDRWPSAREMREGLLAIFEDAFGERFGAIAGSMRMRMASEVLARSEPGGDETQPPRRLGSEDGLAKQLTNQVATWAAKPDIGKKTRLRQIIALGVGVLALGGVLFAAARRHTSTVGPAIPMSATPVSADTPVTALSVSPACDEKSKSHFHAGLIAIRKANWRLAHEAFERAAAADPTCPEVQLQLTVTALTPSFSVGQWREQYHRAVSLRDAMSERDRAVLDCYAPALATEPADFEETARRTQVAAARFPRDAQILILAASGLLGVAPDRAAVEHSFELARRASEIDPRYADAWQLLARPAMAMERYDEALAALDRCLEVSPGATDCLYDRIRMHRLRGDCSAAVSDARNWIASEPASSDAYRELANALASDGAFAETVDIALQQSRNLDSSDERDATYSHDRALLAASIGDFAAAERDIERALTQLSTSASLFSHARAMALLVELRNETGKGSQAAASAEQYFRQKGAWTAGFWGAAYYEPTLFATLLLHGKMGRDRWMTSTDSWEKAVLGTLPNRHIWAFRWGPLAGNRELAREAQKRRPTEEPLAATTKLSRMLPGLAKAFDGRIALTTGDPTGALALLEPTSKTCDILEQPFASTRTRLWLGEAEEAVGNATAACDAYASVIRRWGRAKPRSVTAEEAHRRGRALGCKLDSPEQ